MWSNCTFAAMKYCLFQNEHKMDFSSKYKLGVQMNTTNKSYSNGYKYICQVTKSNRLAQHVHCNLLVSWAWLCRQASGFSGMEWWNGTVIM